MQKIKSWFVRILTAMLQLIKTFKARGKPNPCVTDNICGLMKTRDDWRKKAKESSDPLSWTAYRYFRQEVKREIRIAEQEFVAEQIQRNPNNTNSISNAMQFAIASLRNLQPSEYSIRMTKLLQTNLISSSYLLVRALSTKLHPWLLNAT